MWGLGPPNKRIRVTNAMLANSRRWREGAAPVGAEKLVRYLCHSISFLTKRAERAFVKKLSRQCIFRS